MPKKYLRKIISSGLYPLTSVWEKHRRADTMRILAYHRVNNDVHGDRLSVSTDNFRAQMEFLKSAGYETLLIDEWLEARRQDTDFSRKIAITFDDGYADNVTGALPVLQEAGFRAIFFLATGFIGSDNLVPRYLNWEGNHSWMSWDQARSLVAAGMQVGAHSVNHVKVGHVDINEAEVEIVTCRSDLLENHLPADWFAYPAGSFSAPVVELVRSTGFKGAVTMLPGANSRGEYEYLLKRTEVSGDDSLFDFRKKLVGAYDLQHKCAHYWNQR
ncbi:polysaccharide deacetylase family protein [Planctomycetota bacterium]